jgi:general secretion pathway protein E
MRQDPDIIMVGEIRDLETAEMAVQAALTGHLVLSTLHTNDAPSAVTRLLDLGVPPTCWQHPNGILAQRLVRTLCPHCKQLHSLGAADWAVLADSHAAYPDAATPCRPVGCSECRAPDSRPHRPVRVAAIGLAAARAIRADMDLAGFTAPRAREGLRTLRQAGLEKVAQG